MAWGILLAAIALILIILKIVATGLILPFLFLYIAFQFFTADPQEKFFWFGSYTSSNQRASIVAAQATINPLHFDQNAGHICAYKTTIGCSTIDLRNLDLQPLKAVSVPASVDCTTILGSTTIIIPKDVPVRIHAKTLMGSTELPGETTVIIGSHTYNSADTEHPLIIMQCNCLLGKITIEQV